MGIGVNIWYSQCLVIWIIIVSHRSIFGTSGLQCPTNWIDCGNNKCIASYFRCDGEDDCGTNKDEQDCDNEINMKNCPSDKFHCNDKSHCLPTKWQCDGQNDCEDGSDEKNCDDVRSCDGFQCKSDKKCIPPRWVCDGMQECIDGSDEHNCTNELLMKNKTCKISEGHFLCNNGTCLGPKLVCNKKKDCPHGEDEGAHCNVSTCTKHRCSQNCMETPAGPACYCNPGFRLSNDSKTCNDINECHIDGYCSQKCVNHRGGATCSCFGGYAAINNSCVALGESPLLIYSDSVSIIAIPLRSKKLPFPILHHGSATFGLDYDIVENRIYWTKTRGRANSSIFSTNIIKSEDIRLEIDWGLAEPEDIRIDWLARNIYIADRVLQYIMVCKLGTALCHVLVENVENPRALALDPPAGLMYWSSWGKNAAIYKQGLDGSQKVPFVSKNLIWPNGLALDKVSNRLYWSDSKTMTIERINLDGSHRKKIVHSKIFHPQSIAVFEDYVYWTDWTKYSIERCNKFTGKNYSLLYKDLNAPVGAIHIYHPVLFRSLENPCRSIPCTQLCLLSPGGKATCACIRGFVLSFDAVTCLPDADEPRLYLIEDKQIYQLNTNAIQHSKPFKVPLLTSSSIADVAYDSKNRIMYIGEKEKQMISAINTANYGKKIVIANNVSEITAMDFDYDGENIYWTDGYKGLVEIASKNGSFRKILVNGLTRPYDISLYPEKGLMFIAILGVDSHVAMADMTGKNLRKVEGSDGFCFAVCVDKTRENLYWADSYLKKILVKRINPQGRIENAVTDTGHIVSVAVDDQYLYWLEVERNILYFMNKNTTINPKTITYGSQDRGHSRKLVYVNPQTSKRVACNHNKCSHLCIPSPTGPVCACGNEFKLSSDGTSCEVSKCSNTSFRCGDGECLSIGKKCDEKVDCLDGSDELDCPLSCYKEDFRCKNGRCIHPSWVCNGDDDCTDNSDEENCTTFERKPKRICLADSYHCADGSCIIREYLCNLEKDCPGGEDENATYCASRHCGAGMIRCDSGQCLPEYWLCDGDKDCADGSDEKNCSDRATCSPAEYQCTDGHCIPKAAVCDDVKDCSLNEDEVFCDKCPPGKIPCMDGKTCIFSKDKCDLIKDCPNGEDELHCTIICESFEFPCLSGECIPSVWKCDNHNDCLDGSDENLPQCHHTTQSVTSSTPSCAENMFKCYSGECIPIERTCDGQRDCLDASDESEFCKEQCGADNHGCSQICNTGPTGPFCECVKGFELAEDSVSCLDVDECHMLGSCSHFCSNTKGSYVCSCANGYSLQHNTKCKVNGGSHSLIISTFGHILSIDFVRMKQVIFASDVGSVNGIDYVINKNEKLIIWADTEKNAVMYVSSLNNYTQIEVLLNASYEPKQVAHDWVGQNYYYSSDYNIHACSGKNYFCSSIFKSNKKITTFVLSPNDGILFVGVTNAIGRMEMDGGNHAQFSHKVENPSAIVVDSILKDIYWVEFKRDIIISTDYNGNKRRIVTTEAIYPFALTLFEDQIFWAEWEYPRIFSCNKFTGKEKIKLMEGEHQINQILMSHPVLKLADQRPCERSSCEHLCLLKNKIAVCKCKDGYDFIAGKCQLAACSPDYCHNDGVCHIIGTTRQCSCLIGFDGEKCENRVQNMKASMHEDKSGWIAGVVVGVILIAIIGVSTYMCLKNKSKIGARGRDIIVSFRHSFLQKEEPLIIDTEYTDYSDRKTASEDDTLYNKTESGVGYKKWNNIDTEVET